MTYDYSHPFHAEIKQPARRVNYTLREQIDAILAFLKPPQKMSKDLAAVALREIGTPRPVIDRLLSFVEYR